jgi:ribosomal subunit interface protein
MEKIISSRHFEVNDDMKGFILREMDRIEGEYHKLTSIRMVLDQQKKYFSAEVILHGKNINIEADAQAAQLQPAVIDAIGKADKQLRKHLDKIKSHHNHKKSEKVLRKTLDETVII